MSKMPNKDDLPALANWLDSHAMELVEAIINKHTASILEVLREQVKENRHLRDLLVDRERRAQPAPADDAVRRDAERYRWLRDHGFQHADVYLGTDFDGDNFVSYRIYFNLPEPAHMKFEDDEWGTADVDAAIDAAIAAHRKGGES